MRSLQNYWHDLPNIHGLFWETLTTEAAFLYPYYYLENGTRLYFFQDWFSTVSFIFALCRDHVKLRLAWEQSKCFSVIDDHRASHCGKQFLIKLEEKYNIFARKQLSPRDYVPEWHKCPTTSPYQQVGAISVGASSVLSLGAK